MTTPSISNPLLSKVKLPGRVFQLPSKGLFYKPGVLANTVKDGEIQIKPMSALVELKIRSADLLISYKIIQEVCAECAPEILKPELLLSRDIDAFFVFLVMSTYGKDKVIKSAHDCEKAEVHDYQIDLEVITSNPNNAMLEHRDMIFRTELDNGQVVKLKPVIFSDAVDIILMRQAVNKRELVDPTSITAKDSEDVIIRDLQAVVEGVYVDGDKSQLVTNPAHIVEWIRSLSKKQVDNIIEAATNAANWGFDLSVNLTCKDCGAQYIHNVELNPVNFFSG